MQSKSKRCGGLGLPASVHQVNSEKWTFQDNTVRKWVQDRLEGRVLNACAGETQLKHSGEIVRNDINEDRSADLHVDVKEIDEHVEPESFDTVVYDPPWSVFQVNDKYEGRGQDTIKQSTLIARAIDEVIKPTGRVLSFGYTINMLPTSMNYKIDEVAVFTIPGPGKDFFGAVHSRESKTLDSFS